MSNIEFIFVIALCWGLYRFGLYRGYVNASQDVISGAKHQLIGNASAFSSLDQFFVRKFNFTKNRDGTNLGMKLSELIFEMGCDTNIPSLPSDEISLHMKHKDLEAVAWLANTGFEIWTAATEQWARYGQDQVTKSEAWRLASVIDTFERRTLPDLFSESEDEKEARFNAYENRIKDLVLIYKDAAI